jgi:hypothetical protein
MFVVHCELEGNPDMEFWMHKSGLHYFDPKDSEPTVPQMEQDEPTQVAQPMQTTGLRRST